MADRGVELDLDRKVAGLVIGQDELSLVELEPALGADRRFSQGHPAGQGGGGGQQHAGGAARVADARRGLEGEGSSLVAQPAGQPEIPQRDPPRLGIGHRDAERQGVSGALKAEGHRLGILGLEFFAHGFRQKPDLDRHQAGGVLGSHLDLGHRLDLDVALAEGGLGRDEREGRERVRPRLQLPLGENGNGQLGQGFVRLARAQHQAAGAVGLLAHAPVLQRLARHLPNLPVAGQGQGQLLRLALQNVEGGRDGMGQLLPRDPQGVLERGGENEFLLLAGHSLEHGLDDEAGFAIVQAAVDGDVLHLGGGVGGPAARQAQADEKLGDKNACDDGCVHLVGSLRVFSGGRARGRVNGVSRKGGSTISPGLGSNCGNGLIMAESVRPGTSTSIE